MRQIFLLTILIMSVLPVQIRAEALPEYTLKAAYLYNFALLTEWPKNKQSSDFKLCFYRTDFGAASDALKNKTIHDQKVKVLTVTTFEEVKECQMVFIRETEEKSGKKLIHMLSELPILIVSENLKMSDADIVILQENHKLAFNVSLKSIKDTGLEFSSHLLKLAQKVVYP